MDILTNLHKQLAEARKRLLEADVLPVKEYMIAWRTHKRQIEICESAIEKIELENLA